MASISYPKDEGEEDDDITSSQSDSNVDTTVDQCEEIKGQSCSHTCSRRKGRQQDTKSVEQRDETEME